VRRNARHKHLPDFVAATGLHCATPAKTKFRTRREARYCLRQLKHAGGFGADPPRPYLCACGAWHLGHSGLR